MRRKPKQLTESPDLFVPGGRGGLVLAGSDRSRRGAAPPGAGGAGPGITDESAEVQAADAARAVQTAARARAHRIARTLLLAPPRLRRRAPRGPSGTLVTRRWSGDSDEIDLDATLEVLAATPLPADEDILVRRRVRTRRTVVLAVDVSGSSRGEKVLTAAATVGALAGELSRDAVGVVAFWSDAAIILRPGEKLEPERLIDDLLAMPTEGLTNVAFALRTCGDLIGRASPGRARILLLSDCVHNAGPDPRTLLAALPRLDVLLDVSGEHDLNLGGDLALLGRGRCRPVRTFRDVAPALRRIFAE
nr:VWA domain-containing protein [Millisia brevis]